jgi:hypothetical protein
MISKKIANLFTENCSKSSQMEVITLTPGCDDLAEAYYDNRLYYVFIQLCSEVSIWTFNKAKNLNGYCLIYLGWGGGRLPQ